MPSTNLDVSVMVAVAVTFFASIGYFPSSVPAVTVCVTFVSAASIDGRVMVMLLAEVTRPFASTVIFGTVNVPECAGDALAEGPYVSAVTPELARVAAIDQPPFEDAEPVTSPVSVTLFAAVNSPAEATLAVPSSVWTYFVVAIFVLLSPADGVVDVGVPVKDGEAKEAYVLAK